MRKLLITTSLILLCLLMVDQVRAYDIVLDNYALGAATSASDVGYGWVTSRAVDGNPGSGYHSTENDAIDHWLEVDLGEPKDFDRIEILNRSGYLARLDGARVVTLDAARNVLYTSSPVSGAPLVAQYDSDFTGVQYIRVEQSGPILTVMELRALSIREVPFIPSGSNLTQFGAIATQSTTGAGRPAGIAIDGALGNFNHTDETTPNNWWQVELAGDFYIDRIVIYNRQSCCSERLLNQWLTVSDSSGNELFRYQFTDPNVVGPGSVHTFEMPKPLYGKFVKVGLEDGQPNGQATNDNYVVALEEVQVFGSNYQGAWDPTPQDGAVEVDVDQDLSWRPGEDPNGLVAGTTGYLLYFGADESAVAARDASVKQGGVIEIGSEIFDPGTLAKDTTYYWAVDQRLWDDANSIPGATWSFTTPLTLPIIDAQPADAVTIAGGYASFTVSATDPLGGELTYAWRKVGSSTILSTDATLQLIDVSVGAAGEYVCDVMNINMIQTEPATLTIARAVVEWKFDEASGAVATDSSGNGIDGTLSEALTDDQRVINGGRTGAEGDNAIDLAGIEGASIEALGVDLSGLGVADIFKGDSSWTINMWIMPANANEISMIGGFGRCSWVDGGVQDERCLNTWNTDLEFQPGGNDGFWPGANITSGGWKMITITYDGISGVCTMYVDGAVIGTRVYGGLADVTEQSIKLGDVGPVAHVSTQGLTQVPLDALIDDFSIWDGALGPFEVGMLDKGYGCIEAIAGDVNDDCVVDIADLAIAAGSWLDCGMIPVSECP